MAYTVQDICVSAASDRLAIQSFRDFYAARIDKAISLVDDLSYILSSSGSEDYDRPTLDYGIAYEFTDSSGKSKFLSVDPDQLAQALENDLDEFVDLESGITVNVDNLVDQIKNSVSTSRVIVAACDTLVDSATDTVAAISTSFISKVRLIVGDVTDAVSSMVTDLSSIISSIGVPIGERVKNILSYVGILNVPVGDDVQIGVPESRLTDITGANVYQALIAEMPKKFSQLGKWLKDTVKKIVQVLKSLIQMVVGSGTYRSLMKFLNTLTGRADSFSYFNGDCEDNSLSSHGFSASIGGLEFRDVSWVYSNSLDSVANISYSFYQLCLQDSIPAGADIFSALQTASQYIKTSIIGMNLPDDWDGPLFLKELSRRSSPSFPEWLIPYQDIVYSYPSSLHTIFDLSIWLYYNVACRFVSDDRNSIPDIYTALQFTIGAVLDYYHLDDANALTKHLSTTSYLRLDLAASSVYFWLVGSTIMYTRRVTPLDSFKDMSLPDIKMYFSSMCIPDQNNPGDVWINMLHWKNFQEKMRTSTEFAIQTDREMFRSVWAANYADALYLKIIDAFAYNNLNADYDFSLQHGDLPAFRLPVRHVDVPHPTGFDILDAAQTAFNFMGFLGDVNVLSSLDMDLPDLSISNLTLARVLGAGSALAVFSADSAILAPLRFLFDWIDDEDSYIPYAHTGKIAVGLYRIITDSELANILTLAIEVVVAVVATIYVLKKVKQLKKKAMATRTRADAIAWDMVTKDKYDQAAINQHYKLARRADLCEKLSNAVFGSVTKAVNVVKTSVSSAVSACTSKIQNLLSGGVKQDGHSVSINDTIEDLSDIKSLITG